ncbi:sensor histidine kinase [Halorubrum luteum]
MKYTGRTPFGRSPRVVAGVYLCVGAAWMPTAELVLATYLPSADPMDPARLVAGWLFVVVSAGVVYAVATHHAGRVSDTRNELETSNQQLQVVSRVFRHNVRNDLNVVRGYTELLDDRIDDERSQAYLETIRETTDDIVDISEKLRVIEGASSDRGDDQVDLVAITENVIADVGDQETVTATLDAPSSAWIAADGSVEYPVREVFENAIAHNDKAVCRLDARIETAGEMTCLSVTDNGPGIPDNEREVLQAESETPLSHASSIGLWVIKWLCELQGGTVEFDTTNGGTTVRLRFRTAASSGDDGRRTTQWSPVEN